MKRTAMDFDSNNQTSATARKRSKLEVEKAARSKLIYLNNENTKYEVIPKVCEILGWKTCNDTSKEKKSEWDVYWTGTQFLLITCKFANTFLMKSSYLHSFSDYGLGIERIVRKAHSFQRINHIPGMINIYRKNHLARAMLKMQKVFGDLYDFFPTTWILPHQADEMTQYLTATSDRCVIIKPSGGAQGKGIYLALSPAGVSIQEDSIAQAYVSRPLLIDGLKVATLFSIQLQYRAVT
jgi:hypothetical protein